ncbi:hypothetical protein PBY51_015913 [Eleginops maclovinus]|nr:hypothetical protein PBY51_015913 [Eleginops maclovinus]
METENQPTMDNDFSARLSDKTYQYPTIREGTSSSCRRVKVRSRPRLQSTKSFPPYNQCIGGLGEDGDGDDELYPEPSNVTRGDRNDVFQGTERNEDIELIPRCARDEVKEHWKLRRKERVGESDEVDTDGLERWSGKRRVEEKSECEDGRGKGAQTASGNTAGWSSPHPILSKLLHSSSGSSGSSINFSSAESDDVFSEGEDVGSKRRAFRKSRSWKTYLTMVHWSLRRQGSWVQLAGHQGNFQLSEGGEVLKLYCEVEAKCLDSLMRDALRPFVPQYHGCVTRGEHCYIRLEDLLSGLRRPVIMDCKMGVRTYQEEEVTKAQTRVTLRSDMYQKMVKVDPTAPSVEEHKQKAVTKSRYLQWRDTTSSTSTLGFRIEGIMMEDGSIQRDFKKILTLAKVTEAMLYFTRSQLDILKAYHSRLLALSEALKNSLFFRTHEVIGSSLLFVHDHSSKASVWMIDFGKTTPLPDRLELRHNIPWAEGSREDGYLIGLMSLITSLSQAISMASSQQEESCGEEQSVA